MIEKIGLSDPYGLEYENPDLLLGASEIPVSPEAGKLNISPLRVKLDQWIGDNEPLVIGIVLIALIGLFWVLRG